MPFQIGNFRVRRSAVAIDLGSSTRMLSPAWLEQMHGDLDQTIWTAYGWPYREGAHPADTDDETILLHLLALNLERAEGG